MPMLTNWREEKRAVYLYQKIAARETDIIRKKLFLELAGAAEKQATIWKRKIEKSNPTQLFSYRPDLRTHIVCLLLNCFGAKQMRFILSAMKVRGMSTYAGAPGAHSAASHLEQRHQGLTTAGNLRAAVFGVNDGLVSNMSLLLGMVGAHANSHFIILSGVAGLLAGASSMAAGEYISVKSQKEFFEYQIELEKEELELYPEEETAELAAIYRARGLTKESAMELATVMVNNPKTALDTLAREELGLNPNELGSPIGAAISSFISFAIGAFVPLLPFLMSERSTTIYVSIGLTAIFLASIGAVLSLFTSKSALRSSARMLVIGCMAGAITFLIGRWVGEMFF